MPRPIQEPEKWLFLPELAGIYERSPTDKNSPVPRMPWIKYHEILDAMHELMDDIEKSGTASPGILETVMVIWLNDVAPEKVNYNTMKAIHEFACSISDEVASKARSPPITDPNKLPHIEMPASVANISKGDPVQSHHSVKAPSHHSGGVPSHHSGGAPTQQAAAGGVPPKISKPKIPNKTSTKSITSDKGATSKTSDVCPPKKKVRRAGLDED